MSLASIKSYSCSIARKTGSHCDRVVPSDVRTTASGIKEACVKMNGGGYSWKIRDTLPKTTWTCKRCTLLNSPNVLVCEACESPYCSDMNSNLEPSVIIKVIFIRRNLFRVRIDVYSIFFYVCGRNALQ